MSLYLDLSVKCLSLALSLPLVFSIHYTQDNNPGFQNASCGTRSLTAELISHLLEVWAGQDLSKRLKACACLQEGRDPKLQYATLLSRKLSWCTPTFSSSFCHLCSFIHHFKTNC